MKDPDVQVIRYFLLGIYTALTHKQRVGVIGTILSALESQDDGDSIREDLGDLAGALNGIDDDLLKEEAAA